MTQEKHPFRLKLGSLLPQTAGYKREYPFEFSKIELENDFTLYQLDALISATRTQQGVIIQGKFEGKIKLECVRCLKEYDHILEWDITELYAFDRRDISSEEELILPDNAEIDLSEFITEEAQLEVPINPVCRENCQGLCQTCGANLNEGDCGHEELPQTEDSDEAEHSPFAGLKDLL